MDGWLHMVFSENFRQLGSSFIISPSPFPSYMTTFLSIFSLYWDRDWVGVKLTRDSSGILKIAMIVSLLIGTRVWPFAFIMHLDLTSYLLIHYWINSKHTADGGKVAASNNPLDRNSRLWSYAAWFVRSIPPNRFVYVTTGAQHSIFFTFLKKCILDLISPTGIKINPPSWINIFKQP